MQKHIITTSWDDGNKLDLKLAVLLNKYNLKGTFYIPKDYVRKDLQDDEIKEIAVFQEIGAHSSSHSRSWRTRDISQKEEREEILGSKQYLEKILGTEVKMFCYPYGKFARQTKTTLKDAGFLGARTTKGFQILLPDDLFRFGTTLRVFPRKYFQQILKLRLSPLVFLSWSRLAKGLFDYALKNGEIYHLWGHSWEIEKYKMWKELEEVFEYIAHRKDILYLTNSQALECH